MLSYDPDDPVAQPGRPTAVEELVPVTASPSPTAVEELVPRPFPRPLLHAQPPWPPYPWWVRVWLRLHAWGTHRMLDAFFLALSYGGEKR